jgi:hypothetical protein
MMNHGDTEDTETRALPFLGDFPSPPFKGEREGPTPEAWEGEVGTRLDRGRLARMRPGRQRSERERSGIPHLTPTLSAPEGGEGVGAGLTILRVSAVKLIVPSDLRLR